jgi:hypothetical protein
MTALIARWIRLPLPCRHLGNSGHMYSSNTKLIWIFCTELLISGNPSESARTATITNTDDERSILCFVAPLDASEPL